MVMDITAKSALEPHLSTLWGMTFGLQMLALIPLLILPGYTLTAVIFPQRDMDISERLIISLGLTLAITPLMALIINLLGLSLFSPGAPLLTALTATAIIFLAIASKRGWRYSYVLEDLNASKLKLSPAHFALVITLIAIFAVTLPQEDKPLEFYLLGQNGTINNLGGEKGCGNISVFVSNHGREGSFILEVKKDGKTAEKMPVDLEGGGVWRQDFEIREGESPADFILYKGSDPIRRLHLFCGEKLDQAPDSKG